MDEYGNFLGVHEPYTREQLDALKAVPHPGGGSSSVPSYSTWAEWDRRLYGAFEGTKVDYASKVGDPSASSLIMSGVRWAGSTLPEAPVQVKETTGNKGESEVAPNHPMVQLWRRPNPYYSGSTMMKGFAFSWITKGDVYIRKVWNKARTRPVELWYEPHWLIRPRWLNDNQGAYIYGEEDDPDAFVSYYELDRGTQKYRLEVSEVIHFRDSINPETRCGHNGIAAILREVFGDNEAANMYAALMSNDGIPKFILVADPDVDVSPEKLKEMTDEANRKSTGDNRRKVMALSGVKPFKLPWSPDELDLRASRYMSEDRFAAVTGIPAAELELGAGREHSIYNNVRQASERATERFLTPAWDHIAEELTVQLLPDFETGEKSLLSVKGYDGFAVKAVSGEMRYVTHDLSKVRALQEDEDAKSKRVISEFQGGFITFNEARSARGYEIVDGGDFVLLPMNAIRANKDELARVEPPATQPLQLVKAVEPEQNGHQEEETKGKKDTPSEDEIEEASEWWKRNAPDEAKDLIDSKREAKNIHIAYKLKNVEENPPDAVVQITVNKVQGNGRETKHGEGQP